MRREQGLDVAEDAADRAVLDKFAAAPLDDEPETDSERAAIAEAREDVARGDVLPWDLVRASLDVADLPTPTRESLARALESAKTGPMVDWGGFAAAYAADDAEDEAEHWEPTRQALDIADIPPAAFTEDSGISAEDELAYLSGDGPDPTTTDNAKGEV